MESRWNEKDYGKYSLESQRDRVEFIRKVYSILTVQLFITTLFIFAASFFETYREFVVLHPWVFVLSSVCALIMLIVLYCFKSVNRRAPYNFLLLLLFTLLKSISVSAVVAFCEPLNVLLVATMTFGLTFCLTLYAFTTSADFTVMRGFFITFSFTVFMVLLLCLAIGSSQLYHIIYCPLAVGLYGIYLVYDTQLIVGEKRHKLSYDDYILGALVLYIDILGIFIHLLRISKIK